jgi:hypothetical protein
MPEMWDVEAGEGRGNCPLLWSHMESARALYLLDVARRRRRWGPVGLALWKARQRRRAGRASRRNGPAR